MRRYESLNPEQIPPLWLIYADSPSDSGRAHSDVRKRWQQGDRAVHEAMAEFASFAEMGRCVLPLSHTGAHQLSRGRLARWAMCPKGQGSWLPEVAYMQFTADCHDWDRWSLCLQRYNTASSIERGVCAQGRA